MMQDHPDTGGDVQPAERGVGTEPDTVKVYASDTGNTARRPAGSDSRPAGPLAKMGARMAARPWATLGSVAVAAGVIGALAGFCCGRRHGGRKGGGS